VLLETGALGFSELKDRVQGISDKVLSESLDDLEERDLVDRTVIDDKPVPRQYSLTEWGEQLELVVAAMDQWGSDTSTPTVPTRGRLTTDRIVLDRAVGVVSLATRAMSIPSLQSAPPQSLLDHFDPTIVDRGGVEADFFEELLVLAFALLGVLLLVAGPVAEGDQVPGTSLV